MKPKQLLGRFRAPDEEAAEERAWAVVRTSYEANEAVVPRRSRRSLAVAIAAALITGAVAFSPAGATVGRLITRELGVQHASPALSSLPAPGRLLLSGPAGTWTVNVDGAIRRLGAWTQASWSPHALYVAASRGDQFAVLDPRGNPQWALSRPNISAPRWYSPSGYRIAYLSGSELRVIAGDGSGDHLVDSNVANVAPAWRPGHPYELAYLTARGTAVVRDGESGRLLWSRAQGPGTTQLQWSADGGYLLVTAARAVRLYSSSGKSISRIAPPAGTSVIDSALSPDGRVLALVLGGASNQVVLENLLARGKAPRNVLADPGLRQVLWSPDGRWLLVSWPAADELVFVRVAGKPRIAAVSQIARRFSSASHGAFPQLDGWCCTAAHR